MLTPTDTALAGGAMGRKLPSRIQGLPTDTGIQFQQGNGPMPNAQAPPSLGYRPNMTPQAASPGFNPSSPSLPQNQSGAPMPSVPPLPTPQAAAPMPSVGAGVPTLKGVSVAGIDPNADLRNSTIAPTNDVNRFDLVDQRLKNYDATALPAFQAKVRGITQNNAGMGRLGSGMLNTDLGNETLAAENARNAYFGNLTTDATQGTIADAANNRAELRGERGYQTGAEQSAFERARQGVFDTDTLKNSQFNRDATTTQLGYENNPAGLLAGLSGIISGQGGQTAAGAGANAASGSTLDILKQILARAQGGGGTPTPAPAGGIDQAGVADLLKRIGAGG